MSHGTLQVMVVEGRNLKDKDTFGQNDAYIELYLDKDYKQRTSTIKDTNSPTWNETFNFNLLKGQDHLHVKVYDEDVVGKDSIGSAKISLKKIQQAGGHLDEWVKLPAHLGLGSHGEIHLILRLT
ncbi:unnamed protein product [Rotaria sp. Silwood2]|nr:unnamed protein product [Rotaria sp. Silwood2]CAF2513143.1 unnamed protein product [Rotaria sp. Silwood2]CAF2747863.1 unnamed protein product [Rotaria sp. Silwood2]CAF2892314.1 unnamed protein product [Rotaria sp. Silwood2]CAF3879204.1 unnamed protein product [Rotaria sp. Silwood2]